MTKNLFLLGKPEVGGYDERWAKKLLGEIQHNRVLGKTRSWEVKQEHHAFVFDAQGALILRWYEQFLRIDTIYQYEVLHEQPPVRWMKDFKKQLEALKKIFKMNSLLFLAENDETCDAAYAALLRGEMNYEEVEEVLTKP